VSGNRSSESLEENQELALADAHELYRAGAARLGTNEDTFIHVFTTRNAAQLRTTLQLYQQTFGHALEEVSIILCFHYHPPPKISVMISPYSFSPSSHPCLESKQQLM
jgi:hypothetical protein